MAARKTKARARTKTKASKNARKGKRAGAARSRTSKPGRKKAARSKRPREVSQDVMMAAWEKAMAPGEEHRRLEPLVGTWKTKTTFWMEPGGPPSASDGISEHRWVLGDRFVEQVYRGTAMGMPFEGIGFTGYDNVKRKYIGTWMDSMSTGIMSSLGTGKPSPEKVSFEARSSDPVSRGEITFQCVVNVRDRDHHSYEMWTRTPAGKRYRTMLVEYERRA